MIVVTSDFHIHPYRVCSRDGGADRLRDGLSVLEQTLDVARQHQAVWIFCGDLKMPKTYWPQEALNGIRNVLYAYRDVRKLLLPGNHDERSDSGTGLRPFVGMENIVVAEAQRLEPLDDDLAALLVPWSETPDSAYQQAPILCSHGYLRGSVIGPEDIRLPDKGVDVTAYGRRRRFMLFGDIHKGQMLSSRWMPFNECIRQRQAPTAIPVLPNTITWTIRAPAPWRGEVFYPGSPYQQSFGEREDGPKGCLVINPKTGAVQLVECQSPRFIQLDLESLDDLAAREATAERDLAGHFVRMTVTGAWTRTAGCRDLLDRIRQVSRARFFQVDVVRAPAMTARSTISAALSIEEILSRYVRARPLSGVDAAKVLEAGKKLIGASA